MYAIIRTGGRQFRAEPTNLMVLRAYAYKNLGLLVDARRLGEDIGTSAVLERYVRWRRFDNLTLAAMTDGFDRLFATDNPIIRTVRDAGMAAVNAVPAARRFFMAEAGGSVGDLPRLLKGEAL